MIITDCRPYLKDIDVSGKVLEYGGEKTYGTHPFPAYHVAVKPEDVQRTLDRLGQRVPMHWLQIPIFLIPLELQMWSNGWTGQPYRARVYPTHMVVGVQRPGNGYRETAALIAHELGHVFCYATTGHFFGSGEEPLYREYKKLRNVEVWKDEAALWELRPNELFAEDFRFLFGDEDMQDGDEYRHWQYVRPPGENVRAFMLGLLEQLPAPEPKPEPAPDPTPEPPKEEEQMFKDIEGHWAKADIEKAAKDGVLSGYPDGRFDPDGPVTRAQLAAVANRILAKLPK